jgi:Anti-sigma-K factor rskA, C-terminal
MNHDRIEELLTARVLGGIDDADAATLEAEMATHGDCEECRRLDRELAETASRLAFALEPVAVGGGMADRILASGRAVAPIAPGAGGGSSPAGSRDEVSERRRSRGSYTFVGVAAGIALVALVAATILRPGGRTTEVAAQPAQTIVRFQGDAGGQLAMAYTPGESGVIFWGSDLPDPGADQVYEIWMIQGETPVSGGCLTPAPGGNLAAFVDANVGTTELMAVTVEPATCPDTPSGDPVLTAPLDVA